MPVQPLPAPSAMPSAMIVLARGERPDWQLSQHGDRMLLEETGRPPVEATRLATRQTPAGTVIGARLPDGATMAVSVSFGQCRLNALTQPTGWIARVTVGGRVLSGCFLRRPPTGGNLLD